MSELTQHGRKALERCIRELGKFIELADDYDLDEMSVQALRTGIESMQMRLDANAKPAAGPSEHDESWAEMMEHDYDTAVRGAVISKPEAVAPCGWVLTGPSGACFIPFTHRHVVYATLKVDGCSAIPVYTHPQPVTPAGGEVAGDDDLLRDCDSLLNRIADNSSANYDRRLHEAIRSRLAGFHPTVADAALPRGHRVDDGKQLAMIRDAERYRWWRENIDLLDQQSMLGIAYSCQIPVHNGHVPTAELMDMIADAALNQRGGG